MEIELKDFFRLLKRKFWLIAVIVTLVTGAVAAFSYLYIQPVYEASTKIIVNKTRVVNGESELNVNDVEANIKIMATYRELLKTDWMMKDVLTAHPEFNLTSKQLIEKIRVSETADSQVMTFTVRDSSYPQAAAIINAVTKQFDAKIPELIAVKNIVILNEADPNDQPAPVSPNRIMNTVIAFVLALLLSIVIVVMQEYLDDSLKSEEETEQLLGMPALGVIMKIKQSDYKAKHAKSVPVRGKAGEKAYVTTN